MKLSDLYLISSLVVGSLAYPVRHQHRHKREADIVTEFNTQIVTVTTAIAAAPSTSVTPPATTSATTASTPQLASNGAGETTSLSTIYTTSYITLDDSEVSSYLAQLAQSQASTTSIAIVNKGVHVSHITTSSAPVVTTSQEVSSSSASTSLTQSSFAAAVSTETGVAAYAVKGKGITYSPYADDGSCKSASVVASDLAKLTGFEIIRLYAVDCSGVENVLANLQSNQKLFAGLYSLSTLSADLATLNTAVTSTGSRGWAAIDTVSIGNELVNSGSATTSEIGSAVASARTTLSGYGYTGSVVSVDTLVAVQNNPVLCEYSDYIAVNSHPFWDGNVQPEDSGSWLKTQIANIYGICGSSKPVLITETGWPTQGDTYGTCVPSTANQLTAVESIAEEVGDQVIMFTTYNDLWKDAGPYGVEKYWGIFN